MQLRSFRPAILAAAFLVSGASSAGAQDVEITQAILDLFFKARTAEAAEQEKSDSLTKELDAKIAKFNECKKDYEAAGSVGGRFGGLAARAAIKSKCGASNTDEWEKEKARLRAAPEAAAMSAGGFKKGQYVRLKDRLAGFLGGDRESFGATELAALDARKAELSRMLGISVTGRAIAGGGGGGGGGGDDERSGRRFRERRGMRTGWTTDVAWSYIGDMFEMMYLSGAAMFEKQYQPGQWTRWEMTESDVPDEKTIVERAMFQKNPDGGEWWRTKTIVMYKNDAGQPAADTTIMESLFKPQDEYIRNMVRVRARFPGDKESRELLVPEHMSMLNLLAFPWKPTPESIEGATVGTETVGKVSAKHVKFGGSSGGDVEWWLSDAVPGGWVRFRQAHGEMVDANDKPVVFTMELVAHGTGAKSELGVK